MRCEMLMLAASLDALDTAVIEEARASSAVDPAIEGDGDRGEAMARRIFDMDAERRRIAARAHRAEARLVHGACQPLLHVGEHGLGIALAERTQGRELGELGAMVEGAP